MSNITVSGMGCVTAIGKKVNDVWANLLSGGKGINKLTSNLRLKNENAAYIEEAQNVDYKTALVNITRSALKEALLDANYEVGSLGRGFLIVGTSLGYRLDSSEHVDESVDEWIKEASESFGLIPILVSTACSSGSDAILVGHELLNSGLADLCVCGGADILSDSKRLAHSALGTMSSSDLSAFDQNRNGTILGEGAAFIVLEHEGREGARPLAILKGGGSANDAAGLTAPDQEGKGISLAIDRSLAESGLTADEIDIVNAHGSGTPTNDRVEGKALNDIFHSGKPYLSATKGAFGHTLGATGAIEAVMLIKSLQTGLVPPIRNLADPIELPNLRFPDDVRDKENLNHGLTITIGFGGFNTSLVFARC